MEEQKEKEKEQKEKEQKEKEQKEQKEKEQKENLEKMPTENIELSTDQSNDPDIRHLVLSGGAIWGYKTYGALREAARQGMLDMNKIKTIYATSVGSMIAVVLAMQFEFPVIDDYLIKRPWQNVWGVQMNQILNIYHTRGIYDTGFIREYLAPFFGAQDYSMDITMQEFYEKTSMELHIFVTEINALECIDISYKTHGDWTVVDAVYASCSLPIVFSPIIRKDKCYVDGSLLMNYPLIKCIEAVEDKRQILSVLLTNKIRPTVELVQQANVTENSNFFDYMMVLVQRFLHHRVFMSDTSVEVPFQVYLSAPEFTLDYIDQCMRSQEERRTMIDEGTATMRKYIEEWTLSSR